MKTMLHRVRRLEIQLGPKIERDFARNPRDRFRLVVCAVDHRLNLATSTCTRYVTANGCLMELARLDGIRADITDEELDRFIESFPVDTSRIEGNRAAGRGSVGKSR